LTIPHRPAEETPKPKIRRCVARTHLRSATFVTYDAAVAMAKSDPSWKAGMPLYFYGKEKTLANANHRGVDQEVEAIKSLVRDGWWERAGRIGSRGPKRYRILEHEEYAAKYFNCPPDIYNAETGEKIIKGNAPFEFALPLARRLYEPLAAFLRGLTEEQLANAKEHWKTVTPPSVELKLDVRRASNRGNPRNDSSLEPGKSPEREIPRTGESPLIESGKTPLSDKGKPGLEPGKTPDIAGIKPVSEPVEKPSGFEPLSQSLEEKSVVGVVEAAAPPARTETSLPKPTTNKTENETSPRIPTWIYGLFTAFGGASLNVNPKQQKDARNLAALIQKHGEGLVALAWASFIADQYEKKWFDEHSTGLDGNPYRPKRTDYNAPTQWPLARFLCAPEAEIIVAQKIRDAYRGNENLHGGDPRVAIEEGENRTLELCFYVWGEEMFHPTFFDGDLPSGVVPDGRRLAKLSELLEAMNAKQWPPRAKQPPDNSDSGTGGE